MVGLLAAATLGSSHYDEEKTHSLYPTFCLGAFTQIMQAVKEINHIIPSRLTWE